MDIKDRLKLNPRYSKKIRIVQKIDHRGRSKFFIVHKPTFWSVENITDIPKYKRVRSTLNQAEKVALNLIKNYEKIFMS